MAVQPADVTAAELAVLHALWNGSATIREITDVVYSGGSASEYATVKKLLSRIEAKGLVTRDTSQLAHRFSAAISPDDLIARRLQDVAEDICDGSHTPLLMNLLTHRQYSAPERKQLRELLNELFGADSPK
ncbi:BlaI/MecI/CopY family transcriptional regulator [Allorhodopirellula solitaria]|uniref:Penicillinase repressor n=1 Tax=Allorhodopirellula solitaria TaxID=2527987 RepID=A0A5C5XQV1_9BACT|nr:BlaI/MecI/CopY family transcriptional regulator [Allorhodopirellula solitaria]TWT65280.1 Penicillinase repressor [Allorhodopirellula solitaria]